MRADYDVNVTGTTTVSCPQVVVDSRSIKHGRNARSHGVKYEELKTALDALVADYNAFKLLMKTHFHPGGATSLSLVTLSSHNMTLTPAKSNIFTLE